MWTKIKIWEIRKDALESLKKDYNGRIVKNKKIVISYYYLLPFLISIVFLAIGVTIDKEIANYFITGISIFAGLFFNLLLVVADKLNIRKRLLDNDPNEETRNYVKRYRHFSEQLISQISYGIIISIGLIILMFLTHFKTWLPSTDIVYVKLTYKVLKYLLNGLIFYNGMQFIIMLFVILSSMYVMLLDDLKLKK
jgi:hypothetical protein